MVRKRGRLAACFALLIATIGLPACQSFQGLHWGWNRTDGGDSRSVSYRPVYESIKGRPLYAGGYAGIDYNADSPRRARIPVQTPGVIDGPAPTVTVDQGGWGPQ
jgi:hypothetical protein